MARRKKERLGVVEILGAGLLREGLALGKTATRELVEATDIMSGPKRNRRGRYR